MPDGIEGQSASGNGEGGGGGAGGGAGDPPAIGDELRWRDKASKAEAKVAELETQVAKLKAELDQAKERAKAEEQRRQIEQAIAAADPLDLETARLLINQAVGVAPDADITAVVADLKRRKPFLFRRAANAGPSAMAAGKASPASLTIEDLGDQARASGDRKTLLEYLRARRGA